MDKNKGVVVNWLINKNEESILVNFIDGSNRLLQPGQYILYNDPAEVVKVARQEIVNVGFIDVYRVNSTEFIKVREQVVWQQEGF